MSNIPLEPIIRPFVSGETAPPRAVITQGQGATPIIVLQLGKGNGNSGAKVLQLDASVTVTRYMTKHFVEKSS
jgi:hypothetical protein